jgi:hypothetical protein
MPSTDLPTAPKLAWAVLAWLVVIALGYLVIGQALLSWLAEANGLPKLPDIDSTIVFSLAAAALGLPTLQALRKT